MKIKICGIRREEDVRFLNKSMPDYAGFVYAPSRRNVTPEQALFLRRRLDRRIQVFGVFVNAPAEFICERVKEGSIDAVQLHGDESEQDILELKRQVMVPVIKAVRVREAADIWLADQLPCDFLLLDTFSSAGYGGTGKTFAWQMIPEGLEHPFFLAGGLDEHNIRQALEQAGCYGVDVSGGVETGGVKDGQKIRRLVEIVRSLQR
ncbi:MAG: phosphoribosylanthranilate isomerase [Eubacterium sp.]|nr:phosphoribosylanthranilate isomerase [Eubacterium sp.]